MDIGNQRSQLQKALGCEAPGFDEVTAEIYRQEPCSMIVVPKEATIKYAEPNVSDPLRGLIEAFRKKQTVIENYLPGQNPEEYLPQRFVRPNPQCQQFYEGLPHRFSGDFMTLPVRFDIVGVSPFEAREQILRAGNMPLNLISILSFFYTNHLIMSDDIVWLDALATEISPSGNEKYDDTCYVDRRGKELLSIDWNWGTRARKYRIAPYIVTSALPK